jgi:hypothetical protein
LQRWLPETRVSDERSAFRVKKITPKDFGSSTEVPPNIFDLQPIDIDDGEKRGLQPIISIWDTAVPQDRLVRYRPVGEENRARLYVLRIADVHAIAVPAGAVPLLEQFH